VLSEAGWQTQVFEKGRYGIVSWARTRAEAIKGYDEACRNFADLDTPEHPILFSKTHDQNISDKLAGLFF
jgi:hypothetical protein